MSEEKKTPKTTGVAFTPENRVFLSAQAAAEPEGSMTKVVNRIIEKFRTGQVADVTTITEGKAEYNCIFNLPSLDDKMSQQCPPKVNHPKKFCGDDNVGNLLAHACSKCMRRYEYKKLVDMRVQYPKTFEKHEEPTTMPKEEQPVDGIKCDDCGAECSVSDYQNFGTPLLAMRNAMLEHVKARHFRTYLTAKEWPAALAQKVKAK